MVVGVVPYGVAAATHLGQQLGIAVGIIPNHKEGGLGPELVEHVEHIGRCLGDRAVVKRQIDGALTRAHPPHSVGIEPSEETCRLFDEHQRILVSPATAS